MKTCLNFIALMIQDEICFQSNFMALNLFHRFKNSINWLASPLGISVVRTPKRKWLRPNSILETTVGRYKIQVPSLNPMFWYYQENPDFVGQLGLLTALVREKYPHMAAIDIGANVGDTACIIKTAADVPLLCVEGDDLSFKFLEKNLAQFQNATAHKLYLAEKTDTISASLACAGWNTTILPGTAASTKAIKVMRFDDFIVTQPGWENYKLLKIDTEGFDCAIIRGAKDFIRQVSPVIFFEYSRLGMNLIGETGIETIFMLAELGYSQIAFHDAGGRFICSANLSEGEKIKDLHDYAGAPGNGFYYMDITVFHERDTDIALKFVAAERTRRLKSPA